MDQITPMSKVYQHLQTKEKLEGMKARMNRDAAVKTDAAGKKADAAKAGPEGTRVNYDHKATYSPLDKTESERKRRTDPHKRKLDHFSETLAEDVYARLIEDKQRLEQLSRGVQEKVAVIFADIRSFTYLSSTLPPDRVFRLLNIFLSEMVDVVRDEHGGYIDKIIGDCIMAYFGIPYATDCSLKAVNAAVAMNRRLPRVNTLLEKNGLPPVDIGIGLNTGPVRAGFITTDRHLSGFTIIGSTVNLAAKYEDIARRGQIVVGELTRNEIIKEYSVTDHPNSVMIKNEYGERKTYPGYIVNWE